MAPKRKNENASSVQKKKKIEEQQEEENGSTTTTMGESQVKNYIESGLFKSSFSESGGFKLSSAFNEGDHDDEDESEGDEEPLEQQSSSETSTIDKTSSHGIRICKDPSSLPTPSFNPSSKYAKKQSFLFPLLPLQTAKVIVDKHVENNSYKSLFEDISVTSVIQNNFRDFGMYGQTFFRKNNSEALRKPAHEQVSVSRANRLRLLIQNIEGKHKSKNKH